MATWRTTAADAHCDSHACNPTIAYQTSPSPLHGKHLMSLKTRSHRFLSRSLAMAVAVVCGLTLSSIAQAQMATGSGCTNCGTSSPAVTYGTPVSTHSQPMATQSYPATSYPAATTCGQSYSNGCCSNTQRRCSTSHRRVVRHRHSNASCRTRSRCNSTPVYSSGCGSSGGASYPAASTYHSGNVISHATPVSTPVMQTGAGCPGGNCR